MSYEELKEALIEKGADSKLFDMPAIRERLEKITCSVDDIVINTDGTFNFGNCTMQKSIIEQEEEISVWHDEPPMGDVGYGEGYFSSEKKKVSQDILYLVEHFEVERQKNQALDAPFNLDEEYKPTYREELAKLSIVDVDGFEIETQEIDNGNFVRDELGKGTLSYKSFEEHQNLVSKRLTRSKGKITEEKDGQKWESYDIGKWDLKETATFGTDEGERPVAMILACEDNAQSLEKKYPHLKSSIEKRKQELMQQIDERTLAFRTESINLRGQNDRLQKMLQKTLSFAQTVRDSRVGKIFFGKKAKEVLGEQDKDAKQLPEGR